MSDLRDEQQAASRQRDGQPAQSRQDGQTGQTQQQGQQQQGRSLAEWVSFGVATALLLAFAGLIRFYWFTAPQGPPVLTISPAGEIREVGGQFYVPFTVGNGGSRTAAAVQVSAALRSDGQVVAA